MVLMHEMVSLYLFTPNWIVLATTSHPPPTPTAKLNGSRYSANVEEYSDNTAMAVIRRIAEGTHDGRSFVLSLGSFSSATW